MKGIAHIVGWVFLGVMLLASFDVDLKNTETGGSIDLRNRITGARLFGDHVDPYHYKWHSEDPQAYCDPFNNLALTVSKVTATPTSLLMHVPLAMLNYRTAQTTWLALQWLLLLATAGLWIYQCTASLPQWLIAVFTTGFTYTAAWRLHAERGQVYVLLLFLFACWLTTTLNSKWGNGFIAGFFGGFLAALRPPFLLLVPFLALHRRGQLIGAATGLLFGVGLPLLANPLSWNEYFSAMQENAAYYGAGINPQPPPQAFPGTIEGIPLDTLAGFAAIPFADFSIQALLHGMGIFSFPNFPAMFIVVMLFGLWLWISRQQKAESLLAGLAAWFFVIDLFLPAFRNNYNDVLIPNVVALGVIGVTRISWGVWPCFAALPVGWYLYAAAPEQAWLINLPTLLYTISSVAILFLFTNRAVGRKV